MKRIFLVFLFLSFAWLNATAQPLNVGSYNIRMPNPKDYDHGDGWTQRVDRLCEVIRFSDFDIFGAQEVTSMQLEDMLARLSAYDYVGVGRDDGAKGGEYSPVFYKRDRFRLLDSGTFWLSETPEKVSKGWDGACRRVCSWGHFQDRTTRKRLWFFNLHMDHKGIVARREGAKLVVERIKQMCGANANVILTGDFNVPQTNEIYKIFSESGVLYDSFEKAEFRFAPTGTFNGFNPRNFTTRRIDYIWVSKSAKVDRFGVLTYHFWDDEDSTEHNLNDFPKEVKAKECRLRLPSDHYPIEAFVEFK